MKWGSGATLQPKSPALYFENGAGYLLWEEDMCRILNLVLYLRGKNRPRHNVFPDYAVGEDSGERQIGRSYQ